MNDREQIVRRYIAERARRYWGTAGAQNLIFRLPVWSYPVEAGLSLTEPKMTFVPLPNWAADLGVGPASGLLVYKEHIQPGDGPEYLRTNWLATALALMLSVEEQQHELAHGPIHSYSYKLKGSDERRFGKAWVNRIFLFLRRWAAAMSGADEDRLFGGRPQAEIMLTHDVDAIEKTGAIRFKQGLFCGYNASRNAVKGHFFKAGKKASQALSFLFSSCNYWNFDLILALEERWGLRSTFLFYGGGNPSGLKARLFDPGYTLNDPRLTEVFGFLLTNGWRIGLHPSFQSWNNWQIIAREKTALEFEIGRAVEVCRQHWLRFSFGQTWRMQARAELKTDLTLGFNDRPGFRNSAALAVEPFDLHTLTGFSIISIPMILMDSHLYDYRELSSEQRQATIKDIIDEVRFVGGTASVIWHQQVMNSDYGWIEGYRELLECCQ